ncbi:MAG: hypothetical protein ACYDFU_02455, partial [Nitrospirota bacterium]
MKLLILVFSAMLAFTPTLATAATTGKEKGKPPISQTLVREGDYAVRLAESLKLGKLTDVQAESKLASVGIAPLSGWISDFPVTPDIVAEVKSAVDKSAAEGKITISVKKADEALAKLNTSIGLPVRAAGSTPPKGYESWQNSSQYNNESEEYPPTVIDSYYYDEGPPVVTYYPPPYDYNYLYAWDPFPFWCGGFWFPGYYVLTDFTRVVVINNGGTVVVNGARVLRTGVISNHLLNPRTGRTIVINPVTRTLPASLAQRIPGARTTLADRNIQTRRMAALKTSFSSGVFAGREGKPATGANRISALRNSIARDGVTKFDPKSARSIFSRSVARAETRSSFGGVRGGRSFRGGVGGGRFLNPAPSLYGIHGSRSAGANGFGSGVRGSG